MAAELSKVKAAAADICALAPLSDDARTRLKGRADAGAYLDALIADGLYVDAVRFLAHALPRREGVWWAALCARSAIAPGVGKAETAAAAAEAWVRRPSEETRRAAMAAAESVPNEVPARWAAIAAFWADGSMSPEGQPEVPPGPTLTAQAVTGAVMLSAVRDPPERAADRYRDYLNRGLDIARGGTGRAGEPQLAPRPSRA